MDAKAEAKKLRDQGMTYPQIAEALAAMGIMSQRTGKALTKTGIIYLCGGRKAKAEKGGPRKKRQEFVKIMTEAPAPAVPEKQMVMLMGSPAQIRAMLKENM